MKKVILTLTVVLSVITYAQENKAAVEKMNPEQQTILLVKKMALSLDLNQKQQAEIRVLLLEHVQRKVTLQLAQKAKKEKGEKLTVTEKFEKKAHLLDAQIEFKAKMRTILNEEQFKKWETIQQHRKSKVHHKKHKHQAKQ